jgi:hypothetical protein
LQRVIILYINCEIKKEEKKKKKIDPRKVSLNCGWE